ncbi:MAG: Tol-Pal system protein TolB [Nitrosomonadales bacterium]|jgi:TolB protein|nr:Tol-Pal system protein TolB [Nitrosomonadales bacterium]MBT6014986.1 Tol-Pal system protein TolB [Nitrosomonadales bacterium]MBT6251422.1 Tol-Pal system protein TolB [Nitrosomonadales bacterium]MBT7689259.1 Tol-Pal system protein TolB [Nitrosomonadales bacterium]
MKKFLYVFFVGTLFFSSSILHALEVIEILGGKATQIPIAVMPFKSFGATKNLAKVNSVIKSDLNRSGLFYTLDTRGVSASPNSDKEVNFSQWRSLEAQFLIIGRVDFLQKEKLKVSWSLIDIYKQQTILGGEFVGNKTQIRAIGHKVSDKIYERLTGSKGVFHTKIAFVEKYNNKKFKLNIADYDGYNITSLLDSKMPIISPRWSPDGKNIAYVSFEKQKPIIYIQEIATGKRRLLANFKGNNSAPAWSPDGKRLAIVLTYNTNSQIYLINADGSDVKRLVRSRSITTEPAWSPDGKEIYYTSNQGGGPQIYKFDLESSEVSRVTFEGKYNLYPNLSYDGKLLLYLTQDEGKFKVALQNLQSKQVLKLTKGPLDEAPVFAPNGHMILFVYKDYGKPTKIGTVSINGLKIDPLPLGSRQVQEPAWGPAND